jgi:hypothetical protein
MSAANLPDKFKPDGEDMMSVILGISSTLFPLQSTKSASNYIAIRFSLLQAGCQNTDSENDGSTADKINFSV